MCQNQVGCIVKQHFGMVYKHCYQKVLFYYLVCIKVLNVDKYYIHVGWYLHGTSSKKTNKHDITMAVFDATDWIPHKYPWLHYFHPVYKKTMVLPWNIQKKSNKHNSTIILCPKNMVVLWYSDVPDCNTLVLGMLCLLYSYQWYLHCTPCLKKKHGLMPWDIYKNGITMVYAQW